MHGSRDGFTGTGTHKTHDDGTNVVIPVPRGVDLQRNTKPGSNYNVGTPLEIIAIDITGRFTSSDQGNKYVLVVGGYVTKWTEAYALSNQEAETVARVLAKEFIPRYGVPREIHSDQGRNF